MKRKTIIIIAAIVAVVLLLGLSGGGDSGEQSQGEQESPAPQEHGFGGFEGVYKSKDGKTGLWIDAYGYGVLLEGNFVTEGYLVKVKNDDLSFKLDDVLITFNSNKDTVAFGGFGGTVLYRDADL